MFRIDIGDVIALAIMVILLVLFLFGLALEYIKQWTKSIKKKFKKNQCQHDWMLAPFQKLTDDDTLTYKCVVCGKYEQRRR